MRIGISCYPTWGGSGVVATELAMALASGGDEVHVISYALPSRLQLASPNLFFHEVVVPHYPLFEYPPYSLALASKMAELARHQRLDLLHVHYAVPNAVSAILAKQMLAPRPLAVVTTLHGTDVTLVGNDPSYLETTRWAVLASDAVTAVSDWLRRATDYQLCIEDKAIEVVPNFIEPERYERVRDSAGARRWARPGEKILVHVSNFRPVKRVMDVLDVFLAVRRQMPARLLLVGDGPDRARLEQRCRAEKCCDVVTFLGNLSPVEEVLAGADLFLLPSENESFGLAALEAMACAVPVVATSIGGIPEVVEEGETGLLLPGRRRRGHGRGRRRAARRSGAPPAHGAPGARASRRALLGDGDRRALPRPLRARARRCRRARRAGMTHRAAAGEAASERRELGSRFFAFLAPAPSPEAALEFLESIRHRYPDATHHCFAWRVGWPPSERSSDAGEPSGTAGPPMLAALRGAGVTDVVAVVVRWFGGTKLGKGGLVRAYGGAVRDALARLPVRVARERVRVLARCPPGRAGLVRRLLRPDAVELVAERWGEHPGEAGDELGVERVEIELAVAPDRRDALLSELADLGVEARVE